MKRKYFFFSFLLFIFCSFNLLAINFPQKASKVEDFIPKGWKKLIVEKSMAGEASQLITPESLTSPQTIIYAVIVLSLVPILLIYPFIQKFFKKGVAIGAVKG